MSGIEVVIQNLLEQIEVLKKELDSAGGEEWAKLRHINIDEVLKEIPRTPDGKLDVNRWNNFEGELQLKHYHALRHILDALEKEMPQKQSCGYGAALIATAIFIPGMAMLFTLVLILSSDQDMPCKLSPLWGVLSALTAWLLMAGFSCKIADAQYAIPSSYGELLPRLDKLEVGIKGFCPTGDSQTSSCRNNAYFEALRERHEIRQDLARRGLAWVLATGYSKVWGRLYRAEEAMIEFAPQKTVLEGALLDEARLEGSGIKNRNHLLAKLRKAVASMNPYAAEYLKSSPPPALTIVTTTLPAGTTGASYCASLLAIGGKPPYKWSLAGGKIPDGLQFSTEGMLKGTPAKAGDTIFQLQVSDSNGSTSPPEHITLSIKPAEAFAAAVIGVHEREQMARAVLRHIRYSLNEYRNARWNGLILARNRLLATFILTGFIIFALLAIAIMSGTQRSMIIAATVFFLVGATAGLCNRLRSEAQSESAIPDYGLSAARLITIPLFSGIAAIGGLLFVAYLPIATPALAPNSSPPTIMTASPLPPGMIDKDYPVKTLRATGGSPPYQWRIFKDAKETIPDGLQLNDSGELSGTPTKAGTGHFRVQVMDSTGSKDSKLFIITVNKPPQDNTAPKVSHKTERQKEIHAANETAPEAPKPATDKEEKPADNNIATETNKKSLQNPPKMTDIFNVHNNLIGLFVAAVFGLAPGLLFDRLQQQADKYKADLKSSKPTEAAKKS